MKEKESGSGSGSWEVGEWWNEQLVDADALEEALDGEELVVRVKQHRRVPQRTDADDRHSLLAQMPSISRCREDLRLEGVATALERVAECRPHALREWGGCRGVSVQGVDLGAGQRGTEGVQHFVGHSGPRSRAPLVEHRENRLLRARRRVAHVHRHCELLGHLKHTSHTFATFLQFAYNFDPIINLFQINNKLSQINNKLISFSNQ